MDSKLTIATRGSRLAIRQSEIVREQLQDKFPELKVEFLKVKTQGDKDQTTPLSAFGGTGVFVKGLEQKLLSGEADIAVHSLKDVPSESHPDLELAAFPQRENVQDMLITTDDQSLNSLKIGSVVGTSSPARQVQLQLLRPDLVFKSIRGNVDTRVEKVKNQNYDATILAVAGLKRLGYVLNWENYFTLDEVIPSPGQGALVIQTRKNDKKVLGLVREINDPMVELQVKAERRFMEIIGGGCRFPVAAHAEIIGEGVIFRALAHKPDWQEIQKIKQKVSLHNLIQNVEKIAEDILQKNN